MLLIARFLAGLCFGFVYISIISHIGDNVNKALRGYVLSSITVIVTVVILCGLPATIHGYSPINWHQLVGMWTILFAMIAMLCAWFYNYESVAFLIKNGRELEALDTLRRLRDETEETWALRNEFEEIKLMVIEDYSVPADIKSMSIFYGGNARPLILITTLKALFVFTTNLPIFLFTILLIYPVVGALWGFVIIVTARIVPVIFPILLADRLGRKRFLLISGSGCGSFMTLFLIAYLLLPYEPLNAPGVLSFEYVPMFLLIGFHMFAALGTDPIQHIYSAEAFPLDKRTKSLAFVTCVEYALHVVTVVWVFVGSVNFITESVTSFLVITCTGIFAMTIWLNRVLPETRGMSLRQCRNEFNLEKGTVAYSGARPISFIGAIYS